MTDLLHVREDGIYVNTDEAVRTLSKVQRKLVEKQALQTIMADAMQAWMFQVWRNNGAPGRHWAADSPVTIALKGGAKILIGGSTTRTKLSVPDDGDLHNDMLGKPQRSGTGMVLRLTEPNARKAFWMRRGRRPVEVYQHQVSASTTLATEKRTPTFMPKRNPMGGRPTREWMASLVAELTNELAAE